MVERTDLPRSGRWRPPPPILPSEEAQRGATELRSTPAYGLEVEVDVELIAPLHFTLPLLYLGS